MPLLLDLRPPCWEPVTYIVLFTVEFISFLMVRHGRGQQPIRVHCGYSSILLNNLPGSSLICFKRVSFLLWFYQAPDLRLRLLLTSSVWIWVLALAPLTLTLGISSGLGLVPTSASLYSGQLRAYSCPWRPYSTGSLSVLLAPLQGENGSSEDRVFLNIVPMLLTIASSQQ